MSGYAQIVDLIRRKKEREVWYIDWSNVKLTNHELSRLLDICNYGLSLKCNSYYNYMMYYTCSSVMTKLRRHFIGSNYQWEN